MGTLQSKLNQVKANESFLEKIKRIIPGYDGYVNRDNAREIDTLLRNELAKKLEFNKTKLKNVILNLSKNGKLFETGNLEKIDKKNESIIAKLKSASRGYSGAFDVVKIKDGKLEMLYNFDESLVTHVEKVNSLFNELENKCKENLDLNSIIDNVSFELDEMLKKLEERESLLRSL